MYEVDLLTKFIEANLLIDFRDQAVAKKILLSRFDQGCGLSTK